MLVTSFSVFLRIRAGNDDYYQFEVVLFCNGESFGFQNVSTENADSSLQETNIICTVSLVKPVMQPQMLLLLLQQ